MSYPHVLGLSRPSQLIRVGSLRSVGPDRHLSASVFAPIRWDPRQGRFRRLKEKSGVVLLPIANGIELPQGCGVVDGIACDVGGVETFDRVRVRVGPRAPGLRRRAELDADGSLPFSGTYSAEELAADCASTFTYEYENLDVRFDRVVTMSTVIAATYFLPTSQLGTLVYDNDFEALARSLDRAGAYTDASGVSHLYLDRHRFVSEIPIIARVMFDNTGVARQRITEIGSYLAICARNGEPRCIRAAPPFDGETEMKVKGRIHLRHGKRILLITQILECSHPFPFDKLETMIDQAGRSSGNAPQSAGKGRVRYDRWDFNLEELDATGENPGTDHPPLTGLGRKGTTFSGIKPSNCSIIRHVVDRNGKTAGRPPPKSDPKNSTRGRSKNGDDDARQTHVATQSEQPIQEQEQEQEQSESSRLTPGEAIAITLENLDAMAQIRGAEITCKALTSIKLKYGPWLLNQVRQEGEHRRPSWMRIRNGESPRGILIARICRENKHAYAIEILRQGQEAFSTLIVFSADLLELTDTVLEELFERIDTRQSLPPDLVLTEGLSLEIRRVRHFANSSRHDLCDALDQVLKQDAS